MRSIEVVMSDPSGQLTYTEDIPEIEGDSPAFPNLTINVQLDMVMGCINQKMEAKVGKIWD